MMLCSFCQFFKVPVLKPVLIGRVNQSRLALHHFSHSSIKQRLCNFQKSLQQFMTSLLFEAPLSSVWLEYKWFSAETSGIDFPHALHSLSCAFFALAYRKAQPLAVAHRLFAIAGR